jgi:hypothetical protein
MHCEDSDKQSYLNTSHVSTPYYDSNGQAHHTQANVKAHNAQANVKAHNA